MAVGELMPQSGLVGLWHLNGNSNDASGNGNNGSDTAISYVPGKFGQAASYNGTSSKIQVTDSNSLHFGLNDYACMAWVYPTNLAAGDQDFIGKNTSVGQGYILHRIESDGDLLVQLFTDGANNVNFTTSGVFTNNTWVHIAIVLDAAVTNKCYIYKNGVLINSASRTGAPVLNSTSDLFIGDSQFSGVFFSGRMDEVAIFNRAPSAKEIRNYYAWSKGLRTGSI